MMKNIIKLTICLLLLFTVSGSLEAKGVKTVAVLPFAVHSAESIDYVKQGIGDMLSSRIAVTDKIEVISKDIADGWCTVGKNKSKHETHS